MFAEPRSDVHEIAAGTAKLVRAEGSQSLRGVFKRLPNYMHLTKGDRQWSGTRGGDRMWMTQVRNLSRNQNPDPKYDRYPPIPNCPLVYISMKAGSHSGRFELHELDNPRDVRDAPSAEGWLFDVLER